MTLVIFLWGCGTAKRYASLDELKFGMQLYQVQDLGVALAPISSKLEEKYDVVTYRGSFQPLGKPARHYLGIDTGKPVVYPYLLTFEVLPSLTAEYCQNWISENNITDPNKVKGVMALVGVRPSRLVEVKLDTEELQRIAMIQAAQETARSAYQTRSYNAYSGLQIDAYGPGGTYSDGYYGFSNIQTDDLSVLHPDGYGFGVHMNRFGQPVKLRPDFGGVPGEQLKITTDGYGLGVHMDQYGRPVREYPWP